MIDANEKKYDFDVVIYDDVGSPITEEAATRPMGGSEYHLLQLTRGLVERGFTVRLCQKSTGVIEGALGRSGPIRCQVMVHSRYSSLPSPEYIQADRVVVFATDMPGDATGSVAEDGGAYKHLAPLFRARHPDIATAPATLVCVSGWQRGLFPRAWPSKLIYPFIDDRVYELAPTVEKIPKRFVYASAAMKGLLPTLRKWCELEKTYPREMKGAELFVTTNWDTPSDECAAFFRRPDVTWQGRLSPAGCQDLLLEAEGLFYVNEFPETFGAVAAAAEAAGARAHILCLNSPGGVPEATRGPWVTTDAETFKEDFIEALKDGPERQKAWGAKDLRVSTLMPAWLEALGLPKEAEVAGTSDGVREAESKGIVGGGDHHAQYESSTPPAMPLDLHVHEPLSDVARKMLDAGLESAKRGEIKPMGSFEKYLTDDDKAGLLAGSDTRGSLNKVTIGLVMIAKNEAAVIQRALASVVNIVDAITVVVDSETTDATDEIVRAFGSNAKIPTWAGRRPWRGGFAKTRNEALSLALEHRKTTYLLLLDCDDVYEFPEHWEIVTKSTLTEEIYDVAIEDGGTHYARPVLLRSDVGFRFEGRHHEYIVRGDGGTSYSCVRLANVTYRRLLGGASNATPEMKREKYAREARVFEEEAENAQMEGWIDHRSMYYAGQSWRDAGDNERALFWFRRRAAAGGWAEEAFVAWLSVGDLLFPKLEAAGAYLEAYKLIPARKVEALFGLARLYNENKLFSMTWGLPDLTSTDGKAPEGLFVQVEGYTWRMLYEYAIAATYLANAGGEPPVGHISKGFAESLWKALLRKAPAEQHEGIRKNTGFLNTGSPPLSKKPLLPAYTEFRQRLLAVDLSACSVLDNWKAKCEAAQTWVRTGDLESFVGWSTDLDMNDHPFTTRCYEDLQRDPQWERWKRLSRKSPYGNQHVLVADPEASVVGVSQAFHLMQYENATGERFVDNIDLVLEVGGGYGNLARVLRLDGFSGIHIIIDLPHIREFQKLFLELNDIDVIFYEDDDKDVDDGVWLATEDRLDDAIEMITHVHDLNESAFVSTWGLSETPLAFRGKLFPEIFKESALRKYLIATQWYEWGGVDNVAWFTGWEAEAAKSMVRVSTEVPHHEQQRHLFGCKPELVKK